MKIVGIPFTDVNWSAAEKAEHRGETGTSFWKTVEAGGIRMRVVEYSEGFRSDHFCPRGHILYVLEGDLGVKLKDGSEHMLAQGMSFHCGDDEANPHQAFSRSGARVFIVD
jgi:quercetin dioxygenase-like cupin family protein